MKKIFALISILLSTTALAQAETLESVRALVEKFHNSVPPSRYTLQLETETTTRIDTFIKNKEIIYQGTEHKKTGVVTETIYEGQADGSTIIYSNNGIRREAGNSGQHPSGSLGRVFLYENDFVSASVNEAPEGKTELVINNKSGTSKYILDFANRLILSQVSTKDGRETYKTSRRLSHDVNEKTLEDAVARIKTEATKKEEEQWEKYKNANTNILGATLLGWLIPFAFYFMSTKPRKLVFLLFYGVGFFLLHQVLFVLTKGYLSMIMAVPGSALVNGLRLKNSIFLAAFLGNLTEGFLVGLPLWAVVKFFKRMKRA